VIILKLEIKNLNTNICLETQIIIS